MSKYASGYRTTGVATALLPMASIYATAAVQPEIFEVGIFNTTGTALCVALVRLTTAGTSSAVTTAGYETDDSQTAVATPRQTHSSTGPTITSILRQASLGAAIGSGVIWTFDFGLSIPNATTNGLGLTTPTGTGQICDVYWSWKE